MGKCNHEMCAVLFVSIKIYNHRIKFLNYKLIVAVKVISPIGNIYTLKALLSKTEFVQICKINEKYQICARNFKAYNMPLFSCFVIC